MPGLLPRPLRLEEGERLELQQLVDRHKTPQQIALRAQIISHRSVNLFIRRYEGRGHALLHAVLLPVDLVLRGLRGVVRGARRSSGTRPGD